MPLGNREGIGEAVTREPGDQPAPHSNRLSVGQARRCDGLFDSSFSADAVAASVSGRTALVIGGVRSGKSRFAERLAVDTGLPLSYIATAENRDGEMAARIARHRDDRGPAWATVEEPLALADRLAELAATRQAILVDCLTLWLSNLIEAGRDAAVEGERLAALLRRSIGPIVLVTNEVGSGIVPMNALARQFADAQGRLNQAIADACDNVFLVAAGLPLRLKPNREPEFSL